ncbi:MAG: hypothetical protein ABIH23_10885 [bacterium]
MNKERRHGFSMREIAGRNEPMSFLWTNCLLWSVFVSIAMIFIAIPIHAETFSLKVKKLEDVPIDAKNKLFRTVVGRGYEMQAPDVSRWPGSPTFASLVTKEPSNYQCQKPFRGIAQFASDYFAFVLDSSDIASKGYDRLYFDRNHNGDLTDDGVIEARSIGRSSRGMLVGLLQKLFSSGGRVQREFPRVDITVHVEGEKCEYAFFLYADSRTRDSSGELSWSHVRVNSGAYREGEAELNGKRRRIVLLDFNTNGRFDDLCEIHQNDQRTDVSGDALIIDPNMGFASIRTMNFTSRKEKHPLSDILCVGNSLYDLTISPAGDTITITPTTRPTGRVVMPGYGWDAVVYRDKSVVKIIGDINQAIPLLAGQWRLAEYTIVPNNDDSFMSWPGPDRTFFTAQGTRNSPSFAVPEGESVAFPFGPPIKPLAKISSKNSPVVELDYEIFGSNGEICTDFLVNGSKPEPPALVITTTDGKVVERGKFKDG